MDKYKCPFWKVCTDKNGVVAMSKNITYKILFFYKKIEMHFHLNTKRHTHRFNMAFSAENRNLIDEAIDDARGVFLTNNDLADHWTALERALRGPHTVRVCEELTIYIEMRQREQLCEDSLYNYLRSHDIDPDLSWEEGEKTLTLDEKAHLDTLNDKRNNAAEKTEKQLTELFHWNVDSDDDDGPPAERDW